MSSRHDIEAKGGAIEENVATIKNVIKYLFFYQHEDSSWFYRILFHLLTTWQYIDKNLSLNRDVKSASKGRSFELQCFSI